MTMVVSLITTMVRSKRYLRNERRTDLQQHGLRRIRRRPLCFSKTALLYFNSSMLIMNHGSLAAANRGVAEYELSE